MDKKLGGDASMEEKKETTNLCFFTQKRGKEKKKTIKVTKIGKKVMSIK